MENPNVKTRATVSQVKFSITNIFNFLLIVPIITVYRYVDFKKRLETVKKNGYVAAENLKGATTSRKAYTQACGNGKNPFLGL